MRQITCLGVLCLVWVTQLSAEEVLLPEKKEDFHIFFLVGQSNMAGRGKVMAKDRLPNARVLAFSKDQKWKPAVDPIHFDKSVAGVGLGKTFGITIAEKKPGVVIGLVPCAAGGSPIDSWKPGGYHPSTKTHPYDDAIKRIEVALQHGTLKGILWHQGESDSKPGRSEVYEAKLHELIKRFRSVLKAPEVPFIAGQMGQFAERPWDEHKKRVDAVHQNLPKHIKYSAFVNSNGLKHKGDEVHFDSASYRKLGRRYADAYSKLTTP